MRFQYCFQKIVDLKTSEKTQAEWVLSDAIGILRREEGRLSELHEIKEQLREDLSQAATQRARASEMQLLQQYVNHLDLQIKRKKDEVDSAQESVDVRQHRLTASLLQEKVWLKAKEKAHQQFTAESRKKRADHAG